MTQGAVSPSNQLLYARDINALGEEKRERKSTLCNAPHMTLLKHDHSVIKLGPYPPALPFVSLARDVMGERIFHLFYQPAALSHTHCSTGQRQSELSNQTTDRTHTEPSNQLVVVSPPSYEVGVSYLFFRAFT